MSEESIIIGRNSVWEALQAGRSISKIYIAAGNTAAPLLRIKEYARERDILVETVPSKVLHHLVPDGRHQGVVAFGAAVSFADLTEVLAGVAEKGEVPFLVLLDGIEDVHNLGAIIRTAECAGAHAILVPKRRSAPLNETVGKTSAGAIEYIKLGIPLNKGVAHRAYWQQRAAAESPEKTRLLGNRCRYGRRNRLFPQFAYRTDCPGYWQ